MKENEIILQTPNERMSDLATDIAYLTNMKMSKPMTEDMMHLVDLKIAEMEKEKMQLKEQYK